MFDFKDKTILITGAAIGIGRSVAELLDKAGARLILVDIDDVKLAELTSTLNNSPHVTYKFNFKDIQGIEELILNITRDNGCLDGFVNCVGIRSRTPLSLLKPDKVSEVMMINFGAVLEFIRCISKRGRFNDGLSIVSVSSIAALRGSQTVTVYSASKAAVDAAFRCLAVELSNKKIRLNTVMPGQTNTPAYTELLKMSGSADDPVLKKQYLGVADPADVANAIAFLLSAKARFITGSSIPVDGGFLSN